MDDVSKTLLFYGSPFILDVGIGGFIKKTLYIKFVEYTGLWAELTSVFLILFALYSVFIFLNRIMELTQIGILTLLLMLLKNPFIYVWGVFMIFNLIHYKFIIIPYHLLFYILLLIICFYFQEKLVVKLANLGVREK